MPCVVGKQAMWNIWRWSEGERSRKILYNDCEMDKQSWKWGEKKGGWEFSLEGAKPLAQRTSKRWRRSTATAPISVSGGPDAREYHSVPHFFFFSSLCIFSPLFFFPPSPIRSSLYRSNDSRYLRRCYRTALLSKEFICNCAVLMSEGDVRWYRNCFRMIDDGQM